MYKCCSSFGTYLFLATAMHSTADEVVCCKDSASLVSEVFLRDPSCVCCKTVPLELRLNKDCLF